MVSIEYCALIRKLKAIQVKKTTNHPLLVSEQPQGDPDSFSEWIKIKVHWRALHQDTS
jgi:hypothetical protein